MIDKFEIDLLTIEEQIELLKCSDAKLEQIELLLYRMDSLARHAAADITDMERNNLQCQIEQLKKEIDRITQELPDFLAQNKFLS